MKMSESITTIAPAFVKAQGEMNGAKKSAKNPHFKSDYANLEEIISCAKVALANNDLAFLQPACSQIAGHVGIETWLLHKSGEWMYAEACHLPLVKFTPQEAGSLITYLKRYCLQSLLGIPSEDDDGNASSAIVHGGIISADQVKRLYSLNADQNFTKSVYASFGYASANDINIKHYDAICRQLSPNSAPPQQSQGVL